MNNNTNILLKELIVLLPKYIQYTDNDIRQNIFSAIAEDIFCVSKLLTDYNSNFSYYNICAIMRGMLEKAADFQNLYAYEEEDYLQYLKLIPMLYNSDLSDEQKEINRKTTEYLKMALCSNNRPVDRINRKTRYYLLKRVNEKLESEKLDLKAIKDSLFNYMKWLSLYDPNPTHTPNYYQSFYNKAVSFIDFYADYYGQVSKNDLSIKNNQMFSVLDSIFGNYLHQTVFDQNQTVDLTAIVYSLALTMLTTIQFYREIYQRDDLQELEVLMMRIYICN